MVVLRSSSLRSASLRSTDRAGEDVFVFFMLNFLPALLCNQWYEKCLSYIGTEGSSSTCTQARRNRRRNEPAVKNRTPPRRSMLAGSGTCTTLRSALICANSLVVVPGVKVTVTNSVREYGLPLNIVRLLALWVASLRVVGG